MNAHVSKPAAVPPGPQRLLGCCVRVTTQTGNTHEYKALAASTIAAVMDALAMFGPCKVSASALYPNAWLDAQPAGSAA